MQNLTIELRNAEKGNRRAARAERKGGYILCAYSLLETKSLLQGSGWHLSKMGAPPERRKLLRGESTRQKKGEDLRAKKEKNQVHVYPPFKGDEKEGGKLENAVRRTEGHPRIARTRTPKIGRGEKRPMMSETAHC